MCKILSYMIFFTLCAICSGYKVLLVFPYPSNSNALLGEAYVKILMKVGHEVTYITPYSMKDDTNTLRQIIVGNLNKMLPDEITNITKVIEKNINLDDIRRDWNIAFKISKAVLLNPNVQKLIQNPNEHFDVVIIDWTYSEIYSGFAAVFNCPLIWSTSKEPDASTLKLLNENLTSELSSTQGTSLWQWGIEQWRLLRMKFSRWSNKGIENALFNKAFGLAVIKRGRILPSYDDVKHNASLVLGNSHAAIDDTFGLPRNYVSVAGYYIEEKTLPKNLKTIMDNANDGAILFTMGSTLHGNSLPKGLMAAILEIFKNINRTVIWKYETSLYASDNIHAVKWVPQQSVLAHSNCVLMITTGGLLSINEAIHFSIPIIGMPMFRDQMNNIERAVSKGFAKKVELNYKISSNLKTAIDEILNNSTYKEKAEELSSIYRDRTLPPKQELIFWIEHVIRTKGALHLRSSSPLIPWYRSLYMELIATAIIVIGVLIVFFKFLLERRRRVEDYEFKKFI